MAKTVLRNISFSSTDPSKLINSAVAGGYKLTGVYPTDTGALMAFTNDSEANPEANADFFNSTFGITPLPDPG